MESGRWTEVPETRPVAPIDATPAPSSVFVDAFSFDDPGEASDDAMALARELGLSITAADALHRADRRADESTRRFLEPKLAHLTPPDAMADRAAAADRIARAVRARETICVFGDYDCDGITSAAVLTELLRALGGTVVPLLASRARGGYGFSGPALDRVRSTSATLLVTCDCGSSDHPRLADAKASGIDVVVIDHHLVPPEPLPVVAFLNPHRPECGFPYKGLASCGLALSIAAAVRQRLGVALDLRPSLDLVAIGTIADVAPLTLDNRALVRTGLAVLAQGTRAGLRALSDHARVDAAAGMTGEDVSFRLAPRINAPGRLGDPDLALELLLTRSPFEAQRIAAAIEQISTERRAIQERMISEAVAEIDARGYAREPSIVLAREGWHPGVVGIVAGRIASRYGKPTVIVGIEGSTGRGSVRGPSGFPLHDALTQSRDALEVFGGHQAAAGVEVRADRVELFRSRFSAACDATGAGRAGPGRPRADVRLDDRDDPSVLVRDLALLEPCGEGNRAPRLLVRGAKVRRARDVKGHLKLELDVGKRSWSGFAFSIGSRARELSGSVVDVLGAVRRDTYRGGDAVELRVDAVEPTRAC